MIPHHKQAFLIQTPKGLVSGAEAAGEIYGIQGQTISYHLTRHGNLDRAGIGKGNHGQQRGPGKPISMFGRAWPSRSAMARQLGMSDKLLRKWIAAGKSEAIYGAMIRAEVQA